MRIRLHRWVWFYVPVLWILGYSLASLSTPAVNAEYASHRISPDFKKRIIVKLDCRLLPDSGAYYELPKLGRRVEWPDIEAMLKDLYARGFEITNAWFRSTGDCVPFGAGYSTDVLMPGFFILRLKSADIGLEEWFKFVRIDRPSQVSCEHGVVELWPNTP